ncbi:MAG: hypothetical protein V4563_06365 [Pseudomonadota bacterium]
MTRMQALLTSEQAGAAEVPSVQRRAYHRSLTYFFNSHPRNEAIALAHVAGGYTMSAIAKEAGLSVSRISRIMQTWERREAKSKTCVTLVSAGLIPAHALLHINRQFHIQH